MLGNNFKTILKEERWSKLPTFTVRKRSHELRVPLRAFTKNSNYWRPNYYYAAAGPNPT
jgi:hypothetical protein